jgi:hypothetical protein
MAISYTPGFHPVEWRDNIDRVQAAGDNGFNVRFHDIEDEFDKISDAVRLISDALQALQRRPGIEDVLSIFPTQTGGQDHPFVQGVDGISQFFWIDDNGVPQGAEFADTNIPILLPDGVEIRSLRAVGEFHTSGNVSNDVDIDIILDRLLVRKSSPPEITEILSIHPQKEKDVNGTDVSGDGPFEILKDFQQPEPSIPGLNKVNNKLFSYALEVAWLDSGPGPKSASFIGFQITYAYP